MKYRSTHSSCQLFLAQEQKRLHRLVNVTNSRKHSFINDKYWKGSALFPSHGLTNPLKQLFRCYICKTVFTNVFI